MTRSERGQEQLQDGEQEQESKRRSGRTPLPSSALKCQKTRGQDRKLWCTPCRRKQKGDVCENIQEAEGQGEEPVVGPMEILPTR